MPSFCTASTANGQNTSCPPNVIPSMPFPLSTGSATYVSPPNMSQIYASKPTNSQEINTSDNIRYAFNNCASTFQTFHSFEHSPNELKEASQHHFDSNYPGGMGSMQQDFADMVPFLNTESCRKNINRSKLNSNFRSFKINTNIFFYIYKYFMRKKIIYIICFFCVQFNISINFIPNLSMQ